MDHGHERSTGETSALVPISKISRRTMVAGTLAATVMLAVSPLSHAADVVNADSCDPNSQLEMISFLVLSAALTGVSIQTLAPEFSRGSGDILSADPGVDPINIKDVYLTWIKAYAPRSRFGTLLQIAQDNRQSPDDIVRKVSSSDDNVKFLARSVVLLWYLGSWYEPADLRDVMPGQSAFIPSQVVCAKAYTQALVWQIAGAHPMGYSNLQFGYWSRDPHDLNGPNGSPLPLFSTSKS
jgi:hypothetical protein